MVSAIVTTHNRRKLVKKAIDSVLSQTYKQIECIVVDDAGTDDTSVFLKEYIEKGLIQYIYIPREKSKGGNHARNQGIKASKGEYIAFLDDDDEWLPEKIEKQVNAMENDPEVGFVYCGIITEMNFEPKLRILEPIDEIRYKDGDLSKEVLIRIITTTTTMMVRRCVIDQVGMFDEDLKYWQEYEFSIRILQACKAKCIRENLIIYRIIISDKDRLSNKIYGWEEAVQYIEQKHVKLLGKLSPDEKALREVYKCIDGISRGRAARNYSFIFKYIWCVISDPRRRKIFIRKFRNRRR